jgi:hypothetical protein
MEFGGEGKVKGNYIVSTISKYTITVQVRILQYVLKIVE